MPQKFQMRFWPVRKLNVENIQPIQNETGKLVHVTKKHHEQTAWYLNLVGYHFFSNWFEIILFNELLILYLKSNQIRQPLYNIVRG